MLLLFSSSLVLFYKNIYPILVYKVLTNPRVITLLICTLMNFAMLYNLGYSPSEWFVNASFVIGVFVLLFSDTLIVFPFTFKIVLYILMFLASCYNLIYHVLLLDPTENPIAFSFGGKDFYASEILRSTNLQIILGLIPLFKFVISRNKRRCVFAIQKIPRMYFLGTDWEVREIMERGFFFY